MYNFIVDKEYKRKDIYKIIGISEETKGGNWDTGYNEFNGDFFIFTNVGIPGRTGHNYSNRFIGNELFWYAKENTKLTQPQIQKMINPSGYIFIFYRTDNTKSFVFAGSARLKSFTDTSPVQITWEILNESTIEPLSVSEIAQLPEGQKRQIVSNTYERNPEARKRCIEFYGFACSICGFDFEKVYGEIGKEFIHVHHIKPISEIAEQYYVDPINDLRPVCPNCHAMLHRKKPYLSIEELRMLLSI